MGSADSRRLCKQIQEVMVAKAVRSTVQDIVEVEQIDRCPACDHDGLLVPTVKSGTSDNSLGTAVSMSGIRNKEPDSGAMLEGFDVTDLLCSNWRICGHCAMIFSRTRPVLDATSTWYNPLFKFVENRDFDIWPLPELFLRNQVQTARNMFDILSTHGITENVESVLHMRCNTGHLLHLMSEHLDLTSVTGTEYFEAPARYAADLLGDGNVSLLTSPAPHVPEIEGGYDLILVNHFLTHSPDPRLFVEHLKTRLSNRGRIVFYNEQDHDLVLRHSDHYAKGINVFHNQLFTRTTLQAFLGTCGLEARQIPHPNGLKWSIGHHTMMFSCEIADPVAMPKGNAEESLAVMNTWANMHNRYARMASWPKALRRTYAKSLELRFGSRPSPVDSLPVKDQVTAD